MSSNWKVRAAQLWSEIASADTPGAYAGSVSMSLDILRPSMLDITDISTGGYPSKVDYPGVFLLCRDSPSAMIDVPGIGVFPADDARKGSGWHTGCPAGHRLTMTPDIPASELRETIPELLETLESLREELVDPDVFANVDDAEVRSAYERVKRVCRVLEGDGKLHLCTLTVIPRSDDGKGRASDPFLELVSARINAAFSTASWSISSGGYSSRWAGSRRQVNALTTDVHMKLHTPLPNGCFLLRHEQRGASLQELSSDGVLFMSERVGSDERRKAVHRALSLWKRISTRAVLGSDLSDAGEKLSRLIEALSKFGREQGKGPINMNTMFYRSLYEGFRPFDGVFGSAKEKVSICIPAKYAQVD